ncbi:hypothetical protein K469DRAFT_719336 [Zopfia rhizophila CBS 207.26]|uniref:Apple domain-containing protein n=1 Tax=Zopfia rhizophila CBS 207.26 TaxID=1314779 RepID=A0A6A6DFE4_9PEZI|nr:hypothetical protein K469DRAFT_719336 [Zopfia rhizophila CBS 207.26]
MSAAHSDLEVVPNSEYAGLQYMPNKEAAYSIPVPPDADTFKIRAEGNDGGRDSRTICGLKRKTFWIVAAIVTLLVIGAAVGGGVGGALSQKNSDNANTDDQAAGARTPSVSNSASAGPVTRTSSPSSTTISTTEVAGPTSTILRDCPSANNSIYDVTLGSSQMSFRKVCNLSLQNANGIDNVVGRVTTSLNDCINLCAAYNIQNKTEITEGRSRICNSVCWRNTFDEKNDWPGGMCFGYTTQNSSNTFRFRVPAEDICDGAGWINQAF